MISRSQWGAKPPTGSLSAWPAPPVGVAIHYVGGSGWIGLNDHAQCSAMMRTIQNYAQSGGNGWTYSDIEYNLAACPHGEVFEGRGLEWEGAAQKGANASHVSVLVMANVKDTITGSPLASATNQAVAIIQRRYPSATQVVGHRDTAGNPTGTNCPGDLIEQWITAGRPASGTPTGDDDLTPEEHAWLHDLAAFVGELKVTAPPKGSPPHVGAIQRLNDLHAFMSDIKARVSAAFAKLGV